MTSTHLMGLRCSQCRAVSKRPPLMIIFWMLLAVLRNARSTVTTSLLRFGGSSVILITLSFSKGCCASSISCLVTSTTVGSVWFSGMPFNRVLIIDVTGWLIPSMVGVTNWIVWSFHHGFILAWSCCTLIIDWRRHGGWRGWRWRRWRGVLWLLTHCSIWITSRFFNVYFNFYVVEFTLVVSSFVRLFNWGK